MSEMYVILHNIRSAHNVGSIFRTSDGAGVKKIYLTGYTPAPTDRFGRVREDILKTSLGATESVPYEVVDDVLGLLERLEKDGALIVAVEQTEKAINYEDLKTTKPIAYIFGNETEGIDARVLDHVETHVQIPMKGKKESLNVSVCAGVILFHTSQDSRVSL